MDDEYGTDVDDDEDDDLLSGEEFEVTQPPVGSWQDFAIISASKSWHKKDDDTPRQRVVNVQLMIVNNEDFEGRRMFQSWFMGPKENPQIMNREDFAAFFKAATGERLSSDSKVNIEDLAGTEDMPRLVQGQIADASYKDRKTGETRNEGQIRIKHKSWKPYEGMNDDLDE